ncbi:MmgE/PrpD family protein [Chloroflexota bacterium]
MLDGITERLVDSTLKTSFADLPKEVVDKIKQMLLDSIGCALAGATVDRGKLAIELVKEFGGNPQASIIGSHHTSYALAAFANGELINALDYDYVGPVAPHICPYVTSPCLAIAEHVHASGKELILSLALAHEIGGRFITSIAQKKISKEEPPYYEEWPRYTHAYTVFGGVAGACKLLRLDSKQISNALGIVGASAPVPAGAKWERLAGPAIMVKYNAWSGWVCQLATVAVLLAKKGFTGDTTILDGEWGFWKIVGSPFFNVDNLLGDLGKIWHIGEVEFKLYPTCGLTHAGIEGINRILMEHEIRPEEIDAIRVKGDALLLSPNRAGMEIQSFADVQFSNAYIFAIGAYHGRSPSAAWQMPTIYDSPEVKALAKKVKVEVHPQAEELISSRLKAGKRPNFWNTIVEITAGESKFSTEVISPKGTQDNPVMEEELVEKFRNNACYSMLSTGKTEEIIEIVKKLEEVDDITKLTRLITVD